LAEGDVGAGWSTVGRRGYLEVVAGSEHGRRIMSGRGSKLGGNKQIGGRVAVSPYSIYLFICNVKGGALYTLLAMGGFLLP